MKNKQMEREEHTKSCTKGYSPSISTEMETVLKNNTSKSVEPSFEIEPSSSGEENSSNGDTDSRRIVTKKHSLLTAKPQHLYTVDRSQRHCYL